LRPILDAFLDAYPTVSAKLYLLDRPVNLIDEGIDLALRIAHLPDSSMVAVRVGEVRRIVVAAPSYLCKHPRIDEPGDLAKQQIIAMNNSGVGAWSFPPADGSTIPRTVQFTPRLLVNSVRAAVASAVEGRGVTRPLSYQVAEHVRDGRLQVVLRSDEYTPLPVHIVTPGSAFGSESAPLRGLRRAALAGAVRAPHCGRRRLTLNRSHSGRVLADRRVFDHSRISPVSPAHRVAFLRQPAMASGRQHRKTMTGRWAPLLTPAARAAVAKPVLACARPEAVAALLGLDG
jgi:hypothetical protein